ncbi:MAG: M28 family peptidase [Bacteroidota bacterium]
MKSLLLPLIALILLLIASGCSDDAKPPATPPKPRTKVKVPVFNRDSAYQYIEDQLAFGPRVPNSEGHRNCRDWMVRRLKAFGAQVTEQSFDAKAYTGEILKSTNVIASFNPDAEERVLLAAHWDTRHIADKEEEGSERINEPIMGADDGASGVGVLFEIARQLQAQPIPMGVDIILFDAEDYGDGANDNPESWCLGSQYWSNNPHRKDYQAQFGVLLDMVGARDARFPKEGTSKYFAPQLLDKVWGLAQRMGKSKYFVNEAVSPTVDDHLFVNKLARIPMIDIVNLPADRTYGFYHHTHQDDLPLIDKGTLAAVGQVVLSVVYNTSNGDF